MKGDTFVKFRGEEDVMEEGAGSGFPASGGAMKALTVWQPWASLIMIGAKPYEFRSASYLNRRSYAVHPMPGDRIVIHAAARAVKPVGSTKGADL